MVFWRALLASLLLFGLTACRPDTVELTYRYEPGGSLTYRLVADARARWDIGGPGSGSYRVVFEVIETVESVTAEGAVVEVALSPEDVSENGLPAPASRNRTFTLEVGRDGEVLRVLEVDGVPAGSLEPDQLVFIGTYRPPLPLEAVRLRARWESSQEVRLGAVFQQLTTAGRLVTLDLDEQGDFARLTYAGGGPLVWNTALPQGTAELSGSADTSATATFDLGGGYLRRAASSTSANFEVRVVPGQTAQGAPVTGTLHLELDLGLTNLARTVP